MRFDTDATVMRRYLLSDGRIGYVQSGRTISDDERGLLMWVHPGSQGMRRITLDGDTVRYLPLAQKLTRSTTLAPAEWHSGGILILTPPGTWHSVWWFFDEEGVFRGWYINLETPGRRWEGGHDCRDQALDVWVDPDHTWQWKDEDEFAERTNVPGFWDDAAAAEIRAEGERLISRVEARQFPFDGTWCDFKADPLWEPTQLPWWWDQVPDQSEAVKPEIATPD